MILVATPLSLAIFAVSGGLTRPLGLTLAAGKASSAAWSERPADRAQEGTTLGTRGRSCSSPSSSGCGGPPPRPRRPGGGAGESSAKLWAVSLAHGFFPQRDPAIYGVAGSPSGGGASPPRSTGVPRRRRSVRPLAAALPARRDAVLPPLRRHSSGWPPASSARSYSWPRWRRSGPGVGWPRTAPDELRPSIAGALTALAVLVCPIGHLFGTLSMLEVPGALLVPRRRRRPPARSLATGRREHWRWACITTTALFFLKYNYGLLWLT